MNETRRLVVVGNGMAATRLVQELRRRSGTREWSMTVVGDERQNAYNRVLLSNVLSGATPIDALRLTPVDIDDVDIRLGVTVTSIDRARQLVVTSAGVIPYDVLVLATGSTAVVPPITGLVTPEGGLRPGAAVFRTLDDCKRIIALAEHARTAIVLGGGLLGLEAARGLAGRGLVVDLVHNAPHLMERQLDSTAGNVLSRTIRGLGVRVHTNATTLAMTGTDAITGVQLDDGRALDADLVVIACGVRPNVALARECGLVVERGIVVDDTLRTSDGDIYAIGECAQHEGEVYGLVAPAWEQATVLAELLSDASAPIRYTGSRLVTRLKAAGVELAAMGDVSPANSDCDDDTEVLQFVDAARGTYKKVVVRHGRVSGAILLGDVSTVGTVTQLFDRSALAPHDRLALLFDGGRSAEAQTPARIPDRATICRCNGVTKGAITECWFDGARSTDDVATRTRATTGCGTCRDTVDGIIDWLAASAAAEKC